MQRFTLDDILNATALPEREVPIPELGRAVLIRGFTKAKQQELRGEATLKSPKGNQKAGEVDSNYLEMLMMAHGVVDPPFAPEHVLRLKELPLTITEPILQAILEINGLSREAQAATAATFPDAEQEPDQ